MSREQEDRRNEINNRIEEIQSILLYLQKNFGVQYFFNAQDFKTNFLHVSTAVTETFLDDLRKNYLKFTKECDAVTFLIRNGYFVVKCIDDSDQTSEHTRLIYNQYYIASRVIINNGKSFYLLTLKDGKESEIAFNCNRFIRLIPSEMLN